VSLYGEEYVYVCMYVCMYVYTHTHTQISGYVDIVYDEPSLLSIALREKHLYTNLEPCEVLTGYLSLGRRPAVTGRVHDIGQNVLQTSFQTGSSSSSSYFQIFFPNAFLEEAFIRNLIIILCIYYVIVMCIIDNNAVINNNNMEDSSTLFWCLKFPCTRERISSNFVDNLGKHSQTASPALF
jgi:hypothetical protein